MRKKLFTPGPWEAEENRVFQVAFKSFRVAVVSSNIADYSEEVANAHLIAASPTMLGELEEADAVICQLCKRLNPQHEDCNSCDDRESRLAVIAKAYGDKP